MNIIRQSLYELESQHGKIRQTYEDELNRLRAELHSLRQGVTSGAPHPPVGPTSVGPSGPPPAVPGVPPGPGSYNDPYYSRDRDRERDKDRERADRDREREIRDRREERDRDRPPVESARDQKRIKTERMKSDTRTGKPFISSSARSPPPHGYYATPPPLSATEHYSPLQHPNTKLPPAPGAPPALTPFQGPGLPPPPAAHAPYPPGPGNPPPTGPTEPPAASSSTLVPINNSQNSAGQFPDDLDPHNVPPELKKEGSDWFAVFNGKVKRVLDVSLVHTLMHERCVTDQFN